MSAELDHYIEEIRDAEDAKTLFDVAGRVCVYAGELEHALAWQRGHSQALDSNWSKMHDAAMGAIRAALGMPDSSVPEMVVRIGNLLAMEKGEFGP